MTDYDLKPLKAPRSAGALLRALVGVIETPGLRAPLLRKLLADAGVGRLRETPAEDSLPPGPALPVPAASFPACGDLLQRAVAAAPPDGFPHDTVAGLAAAFRDGSLTPSDEAERVLDATRDSEQRTPPMRFFIAQDEADVRAQAAASTERHRAGKPLGPFDGVPVAVKDELDQTPYPTTVGTRFLGAAPATEDAEVVARLRAAGAVLVGKTNMHEMGIGVTGLNPHHGAARNPHDPSRATGGSSSASAAIVAAGLCPVAVGADGGGSIRIPAGLCGVVGLKATFGRVSEHGAAPLCWSLAHVGPLAASAGDAALAYAVMAGPDPRDPNSLNQPAPTLAGFDAGDLAGLRMGVFRPWFEDAEPDVVRICEDALRGLQDAGAELREVTIPELGLLATVHLVTIASEMAAAHITYDAEHRRHYGHDTRLTLAIARHFGARDYVHAQRLRPRLLRHFTRVLADVDVIVTPATGQTAPPIAQDALATGESDIEKLGRIMRFAQPANVTGLPAISFPAGYDEAGLPVGLQVMGRAWEEHTLLRFAAVAERFVARRAPAVSYRLVDA